MPLGSDPRREEKEMAIRSAAASRGLVPLIPLKASQNYPPFFLANALDDLTQAAFVLADLSLERPSCYYELGLAEALKKDLYLVALEGTTIHQTAARHRVRFFCATENFATFIGTILDEATMHLHQESI
jgi:hypothetical protein